LSFYPELAGGRNMSKSRGGFSTAAKNRATTSTHIYEDFFKMRRQALRAAHRGSQGDASRARHSRRRLRLFEVKDLDEGSGAYVRLLGILSLCVRFRCFWNMSRSPSGFLKEGKNARQHPTASPRNFVPHPSKQNHFSS
jgi:hypothetical protein